MDICKDWREKLIKFQKDLKEINNFKEHECYKCSNNYWCNEKLTHLRFHNKRNSKNYRIKHNLNKKHSMKEIISYLLKENKKLRKKIKHFKTILPDIS